MFRRLWKSCLMVVLVLYDLHVGIVEVNVYIFTTIESMTILEKGQTMSKHLPVRQLSLREGDTAVKLTSNKTSKAF